MISYAGFSFISGLKKYVLQLKPSYNMRKLLFQFILDVIKAEIH